LLASLLAECYGEALKVALMRAFLERLGRGVPRRLRRLPILHIFGVSWSDSIPEGHERIMVCLLTLKRSRLLFVIVALLAISDDQCATAAKNDIEVIIDEATLVRLDRPAAEIVVGNPSIADVSVQSAKVLVVTGKSFGETNLIVMDADGKVVVNRSLIVQEPRTGFVTIYKGASRQTLHCAPHCTPPLVIGDDKKYFNTVGEQIKTKQSISQSSAQGDKQE
jgi:hypothetical protein